MMYKENNRNQIESVSTIYIPFCHYSSLLTKKA